MRTKEQSSRRLFLRQGTLSAAGLLLAGSGIGKGLLAMPSQRASVPAILGGPSAWDTTRWIKWPIWNPATDEGQVLSVLRSGVWSRAGVVTEFEKQWAAALGVKRSLTVVNGTNALIVALNQLDVKGGDEVLVTPYTFIATIQAILSNGAMPVFVDIDPETFQIDPDKLEAKITPRTKAILPVHILGLPADMGRIMAIARKHNLVVVEDACQAPLAEINHQKVGTIGDAGCFSFQNSKNIAIGEGGAIVSRDEAFMDRCYAYSNLGLPYGSLTAGAGPGSNYLGSKVRFTEYQAAIGLAQLKRLEGQTVTRNENAAYLKEKISHTPGILPYKLYPGVTRAAFHLFPFRYKSADFQGLTRAAFLKALQAEGVPCSGGYTVLNTQPFLADTFKSKNYKKLYPAKQLNYQDYLAHNQCPLNDQLCQEAVWFTQNLLLGSKEDMDMIARAIEKVHANAGEIKKALQG